MNIYKITNTVNGKIYVGQTTKKIQSRWREHIKNSQKYPKNKRPLYASIKKYGYEKFTVELIDTAKDKNELDHKEKHWILTLNTLRPNGYNLTNGGEGTLGHKMTEGQKRYLSITRYKKDTICVFDGYTGDFLGKYSTPKEINDKYGGRIHIQEVLSGKIQHSKGMIFRYEKDCQKKDFKLNLIKKFRPKNSCKVLVYDINNCFIGEVNSLSQVSTEYKISKSTLTRNIDKEKVFNGLKFKRKLQ